MFFFEDNYRCMSGHWCWNKYKFPGSFLAFVLVGVCLSFIGRINGRGTRIQRCCVDLERFDHHGVPIELILFRRMHC